MMSEENPGGGGGEGGAVGKGVGEKQVRGGELMVSLGL